MPILVRDNNGYHLAQRAAELASLNTTLGHIQQFQWLGESVPGQWKKGPELFGKTFDC